MLAMFVTRSRLQAVRYKLTFEHYNREQGYTDIRTLIAFSGEVKDPNYGGQAFTDSNMNCVAESRLPEVCAGEDYQVLLVVENYTSVV